LLFALLAFRPALVRPEKRKALRKPSREWLELTSRLHHHKIARSISRARHGRCKRQFLKDFWEVPIPVPVRNKHYKEEIYKRLPCRLAMWRWLRNRRMAHRRGRTYITPAPRSKGYPPATANCAGVRNLVLCKRLPILPNAFYVLFYDETAQTPTLLHPYLDGPDKLTHRLEAINVHRPASR